MIALLACAASARRQPGDAGGQWGRHTAMCGMNVDPAQAAQCQRTADRQYVINQAADDRLAAEQRQGQAMAYEREQHHAAAWRASQARCEPIAVRLRACEVYEYEDLATVVDACAKSLLYRTDEYGQTVCFEHSQGCEQMRACLE